jgi:hypothetical protein
VPCLVILVLLGMPRLALFGLWLFGDGYLGRAFESVLWPVLGFFFMPMTTLAFAYGTNSLQPAGALPDLGWLLVGIGVLLDLGFFGGGVRSRRK